jgi:hypothetical protein
VRFVTVEDAKELVAVDGYNVIVRILALAHNVSA